jgi:1,4-dihydroxy-2-naphthoate polyprenyltransferase
MTRRGKERASSKSPARLSGRPDGANSGNNVKTTFYSFGLIVGPSRPRFLLLALACVLLGYGAAFFTDGRVSFGRFLIVALGAVAAHASVNAFNEYFDFKSGLDLKTRRTPFSGGSGTLPKAPGLASWALVMAIGTLAITLAVGIYFVVVAGWQLLPLGLLGILTIVAYTGWLTRMPLLCLIGPGLGFGTFMVMGTTFALTGRYTWTSAVASMVPFFLVNNLLLLNQFPDVEPDQTIGRKHYPITLGRRNSSIIYAAFLLLAYLSIIGGVIAGKLPPAAMMGLLTIFLAIPSALGAWRNSDNAAKLIPAMGMNVIINLATPTLVGLGLFLGR